LQNLPPQVSLIVLGPLVFAGDAVVLRFAAFLRVSRARPSRALPLHVAL
jgi:hypothetical protein